MKIVLGLAVACWFQVVYAVMGLRLTLRRRFTLISQRIEKSFPKR